MSLSTPHTHPVIILWTIINNNNNNRALRIFLLSSDLLWFFFFVNGLTFRLRIFFFFFLLSFNKNIGTVPRNNKVNYIMFYNILYFFLPTVFFLNFNKFKKRFVFFFCCRCNFYNNILICILNQLVCIKLGAGRFFFF